MAHPDSSQPNAQHTLENLIADVKATAHDQLQAASQLKLDRLQQQIESAWHGDLDRILDERLTEAASRIEHWHQNEAGSKLADIAANSRANARRDLAEQLGRAVRRLREFESEDQWSQALLEGTRGFCERAALFIVNGPTLTMKAARGIDDSGKLDAVPLVSAPAFATAVETRDTVVAMRTRGELSEPIAAVIGESAGARSSIFPLTTRDRVPAILYADSQREELEPAALEMLCGVASAVLESVAAKPRADSGLLVNILPREDGPRTSTWFSLNREDQNLHLRAQRFARVQVAEIRLYKAQAVKAGRTDGDLYRHLKTEIDSGRETFHKDFLTGSDSMVDYFHLELVRTLANDDPALLGTDYPGPAI